MTFVSFGVFVRDEALRLCIFLRRHVNISCSILINSNEQDRVTKRIEIHLNYPPIWFLVMISIIFRLFFSIYITQILQHILNSKPYSILWIKWVFLNSVSELVDVSNHIQIKLFSNPVLKSAMTLLQQRNVKRNIFISIAFERWSPNHLDIEFIFLYFANWHQTTTQIQRINEMKKKEEKSDLKRL